MPLSTQRFLLISLSFLALATSAVAGPFSAVVVYGDSLSDNGNLYAASGNTTPASPPYFAGRRSNGPVAVEQLASNLGAPLLDFAWLGATTGLGNSGDNGTPTSLGSLNLPGMAVELANTQASITPLLSSALFVVWGGPNDFLSPSPLDVTPQAVVNRAVADLISIVTTLSSAGASHILVPGMPDLGLTPYFRAQGVVAAAQASVLTDLFNTTLKNSLPAGVTFFDTASLVRAIAASPGAYGLTDVTDACFTGVTLCGNPNQYLFFDDLHPSAAVHTVVGNAFAAAAVPEPSSLALIGLAFLGMAGWRRRIRTPHFIR